MQTKSSFLRAACALPFIAVSVVGGCTSESSPVQKVGSTTAAATAPARKAIYPVRRGPVAPRDPNAPIIKLKYYGGRVLSHVEVVQVLWGSGLNTDIQNKMGGYYTAVLNSGYMDWLGEYDTIKVPANLKITNGHADTNQHIGRGTFLKTVDITPSVTATTITDSEIQTELTAQIDAGKLPAPSPDDVGGYRTLYMFDFPATITSITQDNGDASCTKFCGYHGTIVYKGKNLAYGVHPDLGSNGCESACGQAATRFGNDTEIHAHELIEATTDPDVGIGTAVDYPLGWYDTAGGEIGDICANDVQGTGTSIATVATYEVQTEWSNAQGKCTAVVAGLPPCVDGKGAACGPCAADADCSGATPVCATDASDYKVGTCVQCKDITKCTGGDVCNKSATSKDDTCGPCSADKECPTAAPRCLIAGGGGGDAGSDAATDAGSGGGGKCVECTVADDCKASTKGPVCDTTTNACRGCKSDTECTTAGTHCVTDASSANAGKCEQCVKDADCTGGTVCDTKKNTCVGCTTGAQCKNPKPACDTTAGACATCKANADCASAADGPECNTAAGTCGAVGTGGSSGSSGGGGGGGTTTSSGCAVSNVGGNSQAAFGFGGALLALGLVVRRRRNGR